METGGGLRRALGIGVLVVLMGGLATLWGGLYTMISTLKAPNVHGDAEEAPELVQVLPSGPVPERDEEAPSLQDALQGVAEATQQVADELGEEPPPLPPELPPEVASPTAQAVQSAIAAGDCAGAADALVEGARGAPQEVELVGPVWSCFEKDRDALGGLDLSDPSAHAAASGPLAGLSARLESYEALDAMGLGEFTGDLLGMGNVAGTLSGDVGLQLQAAELAAASPPTDVAGLSAWAGQAYALGGSMGGATGELLARVQPDQHAAYMSRIQSLLAKDDLPPEIAAAYAQGLELGIERWPDAPTDDLSTDDAAPAVPEGDAAPAGADPAGAPVGEDPVSPPR